MELELNNYNFFWFQTKECQKNIFTILKYEEITNLSNIALQSLNWSQNVVASKRNPKPKST